MMFQTRSIGIDIQLNSVKIAVATTTQHGRIKVLNLIEKKLPEAPEQETKAVTASAIREAFAENALNGDICVASLPAARSINRQVTTPITDSRKIRETLKFQIEPQIPYPIEQVVSDFVVIQKKADATEMLAIAVTKEIVSDRLEILEMAGVDPHIITLDALALADFYINQYDFSPGSTTALLRVGRDSSFLGFFCGDRLSGYRNLDGIPPADAAAEKKMVKEIQRSLLSFQSAEPASSEIRTLCVSGARENLRSMLQDSLRELPVRAVEFNESARAEIELPLSDEMQNYQLAIALAHMGLGTSANMVNFRRDEYAPTSMLSRLKPNIAFSVALLVIALVAWLGSVTAWNRRQSILLDSLNKDMVNIFAGTPLVVKSPDMAQQKIKQEQEKFKLLRNYSSEYIPPIDVLAEAVASIPKDKTITLNDLAISDNVLRMTGEVDSFDDINVFKGKLEDSGLLSEVKIESATKAEKSNKINFRIRARIGQEQSELSADLQAAPEPTARANPQAGATPQAGTNKRTSPKTEAGKKR